MVTTHLLTVWNPTYADDALDAHVRVLLDHAGASIDPDKADVYVWWGMVRSMHRQARRPHLPEIQRLAAHIDAHPDDECHLYLTDYRSLYVGNLDAISFDEPTDTGHVPAYYQTQKLACDFWFRLSDIRRLVVDDLPAVCRELRSLRNLGYHDRPVSIYGGIVDLPLLLKREDDVSWFTDEDYDPLDGKLWVEFDRDSGGGTGEMMAYLRDDVLGEACWNALQPTTRVFLATAERVWRDRRNDLGVDFSPVLNSFAKAVEVETNAVLRKLLPSVPANDRIVNVDGRGTDLLDALPLTLGAMSRAIAGEHGRMEALVKASGNGGWLTAQWPAVLDDLTRFRNPGSHGSITKRDDARRWRNRLLGVGCKSDFVELTGAVSKR